MQCKRQIYKYKTHFYWRLICYVTRLMNCINITLFYCRLSFQPEIGLMPMNEIIFILLPPLRLKVNLAWPGRWNGPASGGFVFVLKNHGEKFVQDYIVRISLEWNKLMISMRNLPPSRTFITKHLPSTKARHPPYCEFQAEWMEFLKEISTPG